VSGGELVLEAAPGRARGSASALVVNDQCARGQRDPNLRRGRAPIAASGGIARLATPPPASTVSMRAAAHQRERVARRGIRDLERCRRGRAARSCTGSEVGSDRDSAKLDGGNEIKMK
jgi:hypothetical protein